MIIEHDARGRITHIVADPVPPGLEKAIRDNGVEFLSFLPIPQPAEPAIGEDGEPLLDEKGEPVMRSPGYDFVTATIEADYIENGRVTSRPVFDAPELIEIPADGTAEAVIDGLPDPCLIRVDGEAATVEGGVLTLTADVPAEYTIELVQWPYIEKTVRVIAHAPDA